MSQGTRTRRLVNSGLLSNFIFPLAPSVFPPPQCSPSPWPSRHSSQLEFISVHSPLSLTHHSQSLMEEHCLEGAPKSKRSARASGGKVLSLAGPTAFSGNILEGAGVDSSNFPRGPRYLDAVVRSLRNLWGSCGPLSKAPLRQKELCAPPGTCKALTPAPTTSGLTLGTGTGGEAATTCHCPGIMTMGTICL